MQNNGLHPIQPVIYLTELLQDQLAWKGYSLEDLFHFPKLAKAFGDREIIAFLALNDKSGDDLIPNVFPVGSDAIFRQWYQVVTNLDTDDRNSLIERLDRLKVELSLNKHSALETITARDQDNQNKDYHIVHDADAIYIIYKNNLSKIFENKEPGQQLEFVRDVVNILNQYHGYMHTVNTDWFHRYVQLL